MIQPNNLPDNLTQFLWDNRALQAYRANLAQFSDDIRLPTNEDTWIDQAFTWDHTPQGSGYWDEIDSKWQTHIDSCI